MGLIVDTAKSVFRDYNTDGVPASGPHKPAKSEIEALFGTVETSLATSLLGSVSVVKDTRANLNADLAHPADTLALVYADATDANNDLYVKTGGSGAGGWTLLTVLHDAVENLTADALATVAQAVTDAQDARDDAIAAAAALPLERSRRLQAAIKAVAQDPAKLTFFMTKVAARTYSGGAPVLATVTPEIGPVLNGAAFGGIQGQPRETAEGFVPDAGLSAATPIFANAKDFCLMLVVVQPTLSGTFATKAAADASIGTGGQLPARTVFKINNPAALLANTEGYGQPPADTLLSGQWASLNQSYAYMWDTGFNAYFNYTAFVADIGADGSHRIELGIDGLGRPSGFLYNGAPGGGEVGGQNAVVGMHRDWIAYQAGKPQLWRFECYNGRLALYVNGIELDAKSSAIAFALTRVGFYGKHEIRCAVGVENCDFTQRRLIHDAIAREYGTPEQYWTPVVDLIVHQDQSRTANVGDGTGDPNNPDPISGWGGGIAARDGGDGIGPYDIKLGRPTLQLTPGLYSFRSLDVAQDIGPFHSGSGTVVGTVNGNPSHTQSGSGNETIEAGIWGGYTKWLGDKANHLLILGATYGGQTHAFLESRSGRFLHSLPAYPASDFTGLYPRDALNRAVKLAQQWARERGQRLRLIAVSDLQVETDVGTVGISTVRENDARAWILNELNHLVDEHDPAPLAIFKCESYSFDGFSMGSNLGGSVEYRDDKQRRIGLNRDAGFRARILTSIYAHQGRFIHWPSLLLRKLGEAMGDIIGRALALGDDEALQPVSAVRSGGNIVITLNKPVNIVATQAPSVLGILQTGGFNTYGLVYLPVGGVKTISGNVTLSGDGLTITVPISGGGPDAGDIIKATGELARWTNFKSREVRTGVFKDMNWPAMPFASAAPTFDDTGPYNDISEWLAPFAIVLA